MLSFKILETKITAYLVSVIVPLLAFSIFFADLICSILSIFFFLYLIKKNPLIFFKNIFVLVSFLIYFLCLISSFLSEEILFSLKSSLPLIRIVIFIILLSYLFQNNKFFLNIFYNFLKYTFLILIIIGLAQYIYEYYYILVNDKSGMIYIRLRLPFSDEEKLGSLFVRLYGLLIAVYVLKKDFKKSENIFLFILTSLVSVVVLLSGERSSLFFWILFLMICFVCLNINWKFKFSIFLSFFIIFFLILSQNTKVADRMLFDENNRLKFKSLSMGSFDGVNSDLIIFTAQHTSHYLSGLEMFYDKPLIGQGPRMFRRLCHNESFNIEVDGRKSCSTHPHNTYIQLLSETGILSTLLFSLGFFKLSYFFIKHLISKILFKKKYLNNYQVIICALAFTFFWPISPNGNFFNNWMLIVSAFSISLYINEFFKYKDYR